MTARFKYQWSKRTNPLHTITLWGSHTLEEALAATDIWRRDLRAGVPWRIIDAATGATLVHGEGGSR